MIQNKSINRNCGHILSAIIMSLLCTSVFAQNVSNITAMQEERKIIVSYDLYQTADITLYVSTDGGKTYQQLNSVRGDVGKNISAGHKTIVWDVLSERESLKGDNIVFKVEAQAINADLTFTVNGVTFKMIYVKGGTFTMGCTGGCKLDEIPAHRVTLSDYWIGEIEVTQALWKAVMGNNPSYFKGDNLPVERVSWNDCHTFINKLNQLTGKHYRLPTEAEWEYAARGGNRSHENEYAGSYSIEKVAWYSENSGSKTHIVATKGRNELGLYDMSGNVYEWCEDWYGPYSNESQTNPIGPSSGVNRVLRGGSFKFSEARCRVFARNFHYPEYSDGYYGFRLVLEQ